MQGLDWVCCTERRNSLHDADPAVYIMETGTFLAKYYIKRKLSA